MHTSNKCMSAFNKCPHTDFLASFCLRSYELWRVRVWHYVVKPGVTPTPLSTGLPLMDALCPTPPEPWFTQTAHWTSSSALSRTLVCLHPGGCACVVDWTKLVVCLCTQKPIGLKYLQTHKVIKFWVWRSVSLHIDKGHNRMKSDLFTLMVKFPSYLCAFLYSSHTSKFLLDGTFWIIWKSAPLKLTHLLIMFV